MYKYLLVKAVYDGTNFIFAIFEFAYFSDGHGTTRNSYILQIWYIWFYFYGRLICQLCSGFMEVAATFDCYITINKRCDCCLKRFCFWVVVVVSMLYSAIYYSYFLFIREIVPINIGNLSKEESLYKLETTPFYYSSAKTYLNLIHALVRDLVILIALIVLNVLILWSLVKSTKRKRRLGASNAQIQQSEKAKRKKVLMVFFTGLCFGVGHFFDLIYSIPHTNSEAWFCFYYIALIFLHSSHVIPFFLYFAFNSTFRRYIWPRNPVVCILKGVYQYFCTLITICTW